MAFPARCAEICANEPVPIHPVHGIDVHIQQAGHDQRDERGGQQECDERGDARFAQHMHVCFRRVARVVAEGEPWGGHVQVNKESVEVSHRFEAHQHGGEGVMIHPSERPRCQDRDQGNDEKERHGSGQAQQGHEPTCASRFLFGRRPLRHSRQQPGANAGESAERSNDQREVEHQYRHEQHGERAKCMHGVVDEERCGTARPPFAIVVAAPASGESDQQRRLEEKHQQIERNAEADVEFHVHAVMQPGRREEPGERELKQPAGDGAGGQSEEDLRPAALPEFVKLDHPADKRFHLLPLRLRTDGERL